jgi:hypothetical protein
VEAYVYQAALVCAGCGERIRRKLTEEGRAPQDPADEASYDSDDFPKGPYPNGGGETDAPAHCDVCEVYLQAPLTRDGVEDAVERIRRFLIARFRKEEDQGNLGVLIAWAEDLRRYGLEPEEKAIIELILAAQGAT